MQNIKQSLAKFLKSWKKVSKHHVDFLTAILTIPVLLSVIILNYSNLQKPKTNANPTPTPQSSGSQIIVVPQDKNNQNSTSNPTLATCTKDIGPISISSPQEGDKLSDNPVCITINYADSGYCSVVWSYRINGGTWSDFSSNNPCIYNLPNGNVKFDLKVQSTVIQKQEDLTRNFIYNGSLATPTPASASATTQ